MSKQRDITCQLLVIGAGMAGMAASLFAARRGIDTVQVGLGGTIPFASGLLDLLGVHPVPEGQILTDPWEGMARLRRVSPAHPYTRIGNQDMQAAWRQCLGFLADAGQPYVLQAERNMQVITPVGTVKTTYAVPHTMAAADDALVRRPPCLLVDFAGLKGFSARQIAATLGASWPDLRAVRLAVPRMQGELQPERLGRFLENGEHCRQIAATIHRRLDGARAVGLPAVVGVHRTRPNFEAMQQILGVPLFEIPTLLPSVPGLRLRETFEQHLPRLGVRAWYQHRVTAVEARRANEFRIGIGRDADGFRARTQAVILATGRFFGKGLHADRTAIRETLFDLPVDQPPQRDEWHHKDLLHPAGHAINRAGLAVDDCFRPVDVNGRRVYARLFAAGSILAHQDWVREKSGSGLAIGSAYAAVRACERLLG
ncbi:MAG: glycerol-3-phosphate dehydrogenase subunit GlpB [Desulfobacterales bacterium]|nr:glycerol-3-phosphate dehydrogenase subunit GlpB [Desulfobacterales bacterium]